MTDEPTDIGTILSSERPTPQAEVPQAVTETTTEQPRDDKGKFAPKQAEVVTKQQEPTGEKPLETTPPVAQPQNNRPPEGHVPLAALVDQRLEARQAKQERDELRRQLAELQKPKQEPVDFYADPDAALNQRLEPFQQKFDRTISTLTLRASKAEAIASHGKGAVVEMETALAEMMEKGDPEVGQLRQHLLGSDDPVGLAMDWYQRRKVMSEVGPDPAAYREKLRAEIIAEMQAGQPEQQQPKPSPIMPSNLAGARNVGTRAGPVWAGPAPLEDIFKR